MPSIVRLDKKGLNDLIDNIKASGNNPPPELENIMSEIIEDERGQRPVKRREASLRIMVEEPTTEERLEEEVGELFPEGITGKVLSEVIEMDRNYTLAELKKMAVEAGLSPSGHKKALAAKLIAKGVE
ncbi:hypothetical protein LCGC14_2907770 [marine sediment metagenome]|uniref:SAP domain-containing protein n=1 Tax=marine sediment metagenome TaxID=412755 RepID=A0A0F8XSJ1_9ZZZZ